MFDISISIFYKILNIILRIEKANNFETQIYQNPIKHASGLRPGELWRLMWKYGIWCEHIVSIWHLSWTYGENVVHYMAFDVNIIWWKYGAWCENMVDMLWRLMWEDGGNIAFDVKILRFVRTFVCAFVRTSVRTSIRTVTTIVRTFVRACVRTSVYTFVRASVRTFNRTFVRAFQGTLKKQPLYF